MDGPYSVHYLMIPQPLNDLINEDIERSVSRMQSVIELGRVLRDRKTMPVKYPLPELIVIHTDQECLDDVKSLEVIFFLVFFPSYKLFGSDKACWQNWVFKGKNYNFGVSG